MDNFISERLLKRMKIGKLHLQKLRTIWNIDGTHNKAGTIKDFVDLQVRVGPKIEEMKFLVTDLGEDKIVLGYPWLAAFQPKINWKEATIAEDMQPIVIKTLGLKMDKEVTRIAKAWTEFAVSTAEPGEEIFIARIEGEILNRASTSTELAVKALPTEEKTWDQIVPPQYHKWRKVFSEKELNRLPKHQPWDLTIDFIEGAPKIMDCKIYPLTLSEDEKMREYIRTELEKHFIRHSKSPICSPPFFVGKKDGKQCLVIDYRKVNAVTIADNGTIPLLQEEIDKVKDARLFTKLDVRTGYNNIRIKEGDEHKAAFKTNMGLFRTSGNAIWTAKCAGSIPAHDEHTIRRSNRNRKSPGLYR
jgi:hypothetical protein